MKYYFVAFEDIVIDETVKRLEALEQNSDSLLDASIDMITDVNPSLFDQPIPLEQMPTGPLERFQTNVSFKEQPKPPLGRILMKKAALIIAILAWWCAFCTIFSYFEQWSFLDSVYFTFITFTSIGYGDFTIKNSWSREFWYVFMFNKVKK
jgi:hypothetical protein